ncbi:hypothetical protein EYF80_000835 [Liparis tanakae]|uniref:Uncharacterized protein n=1 Tax=Liparis tanakae TaxID=230148 RepID=A0A4Z2JG39_9TELE|nr:hypothetical protein EYF80_000835 [Liparis tanakae]
MGLIAEKQAPRYETVVAAFTKLLMDGSSTPGIHSSDQSDHHEIVFSKQRMKGDNSRLWRRIVCSWDELPVREKERSSGARWKRNTALSRITDVELKEVLSYLLCAVEAVIGSGLMNDRGAEGGEGWTEPAPTAIQAHTMRGRQETFVCELPKGGGGGRGMQDEGTRGVCMGSVVRQSCMGKEG